MGPECLESRTAEYDHRQGHFTEFGFFVFGTYSMLYRPAIPAIDRRVLACEQHRYLPMGWSQRTPVRPEALKYVNVVRKLARFIEVGSVPCFEDNREL
jgi:hypothetical protein